MLLRTISTSNDPMLCQVKKLYESAFPKAERRPFESICEFIEQN